MTDKPHLEIKLGIDKLRERVPIQTSQPITWLTFSARDAKGTARERLEIKE